VSAEILDQSGDPNVKKTEINRSTGGNLTGGNRLSTQKMLNNRESEEFHDAYDK
jgi:hypothetical protein